MATATVTEVAPQLVNAYSRTFKGFSSDPDSMRDAWTESVDQLARLNPTDPGQAIQAHAYTSILEQVLFASGQIRTT